ncbi:TPA: dsDNA nuclease domain-containing protein [Yersinia enterocolitica]
MNELHEIKPREQAGRDTLERYNAQVRAASIACLSILEGKDIVRVYCEFHDDFVIEKNKLGKITYSFVQVKTKDKLSDIWKLNDVFGILTRNSKKNPQTDEKVVNSFIGKLIQHTINFPETCENIIFMTNTHVNEDIDAVVTDLLNESFSNKYTLFLIDKFNGCFSPALDLTDEQIKRNLKKIIINSDVQYIKSQDNNFDLLARDVIYKYSEIDLQYVEAREIIISLQSLVNSKSSVKIKSVTKDSLLSASGVGIDDLLSVLSISKVAYYDLLNGGDEKAIKSASVIERMLRRAGAKDDEVEYCAKCKTKWDGWLRINRHVLPTIDITVIEGYIGDIISELSRGGNVVRLSLLRTLMNNLIDKLEKEKIVYDLNNDLICGGIFSQLVRNEK